jgi:hypothetical protein
VSSALTSDSIALRNTTTDQTISPGDIALVYNMPTNTATLTFPNFTYGALPDGDYRLSLTASAVTDLFGNGLPGDFTYDFFVLAGDADHDRDVDVNDLGILASNWQQSSRTFGQGDFDYTGTVDVSDLGIFASRWQQQLAAPSALAGSNAARRSIASRVSDLVFQIDQMPK